jgi:hypothetical protein
VERGFIVVAKRKRAFLFGVSGLRDEAAFLFLGWCGEAATKAATGDVKNPVLLSVPKASLNPTAATLTARSRIRNAPNFGVNSLVHAAKVAVTA